MVFLVRAVDFFHWRKDLFFIVVIEKNSPHGAGLCGQSDIVLILALSDHDGFALFIQLKNITGYCYTGGGTDAF